jgi:hypothetical protein
MNNNSPTIFLDFFSGSHGHFLEYVINAYIFKGPRVANFFTELGASHGIRHDPDYMSNRVVGAAHYTEFKIDVPETPTQVVRISVASQIEKIIYQINIMHRSGDMPVEKKIMLVPESVRNNKHQLRLDHFSKLNDKGYSLPGNWRWNNIPSYEFAMGSLFDLCDFHIELKKLAHFLNHSFSPDESLAELWQEFMQRNQGWNYWKKSHDLITRSLANENFEFDADIWTQALLNYWLSQSIGICDGVLFDADTYPSNTNQIYQIVQQYICDFDNRFS